MNGLIGCIRYGEGEERGSPRRARREPNGRTTRTQRGGFGFFFLPELLGVADR